jgi:Carbohydrate esterase, sialic acid-specific acetylesterase
MLLKLMLLSATASGLLLLGMPIGSSQEITQPAPKQQVLKHDGKPADMTKPVQVFILLGQSNMVGAGKVKGANGSLEFAVKEKKKYPYLLQDDGKWTERKDVRFVRYMSGRGPLNNDWMAVNGNTIGPEFGIGHPLGNAIDAPVMVLKCCIGNRALGWDLLPPGSERFEFATKDKSGIEKKLVFAGYKDKPESWEMDPAKGLKTEPAPWVDKAGKPIDWYAGKQWDTDVGDAKKALSDLEKHYPGAKNYEVAGFFFWQGERDAGTAGHASRYEKNLVHFIKTLRKDFDAPNAKFVLATMGESVKGGTGPGGQILEAQLAVDGSAGKYPEFKGNVATIYTHPMAQGGSGNGHYGGKAEVYMDVGESMGVAMTKLFGAGTK